MSMILKEDGTLNKGFEILLKQICKMMAIDPELIVGQINGIHNALVTHSAKQDEIISRLKRIEDGQRKPNDDIRREENLSDQGTVGGKSNGSVEQSS